MVQPRLIRPVWVTISQRDTSATAYDREAREVVGSLIRYKSADVRVRAQVDVDENESPNYSADEAQTRLVLTFRYKDLEAASYTPLRGDKVKQIGNRSVTAYMNEFQPAGHYPDQGGATLLLVTLVKNEALR